MMITRENQRKRKISFPAISEKMFLGGHEENAKSAVINILGVKFFFWIEKIVLAGTSISRNVPTLTIRGVF